MGANQSIMDCCTTRDKDAPVLHPPETDAPQVEKNTFGRQAADAQRARFHANAYSDQQQQQQQQRQQQQQQSPLVNAARNFDSSAKIEAFEERQHQAEDNSGKKIGALLTPGSLHKPAFLTRVDTPKVQGFRLTQAETPDKVTEVSAVPLQPLPETPRWIATNDAPCGICAEVLVNESNTAPPPPPRPGFRATAFDKEARAKTDVVLTTSGKGVPDPPLALPADAAEATKVAEAIEMTEIEAARAAEFAQGGGGSSDSLSSSRQSLLRKAGSSCQEKHQWSVNSENSLVAQLAEHMQRQRANRVHEDQLMQRRSPSEPRLEAKLADRMEQQLSKERTGVGTAALVRQNTWDGAGIGFVDKALERRLEQQRLKAEGMRPSVSCENL